MCWTFRWILIEFAEVGSHCARLLQPWENRVTDRMASDTKVFCFATNLLHEFMLRSTYSELGSFPLTVDRRAVVLSRELEPIDQSYHESHSSRAVNLILPKRMV